MPHWPELPNVYLGALRVVALQKETSKGLIWKQIYMASILFLLQIQIFIMTWQLLEAKEPPVFPSAPPQTTGSVSRKYQKEGNLVAAWSLSSDSTAIYSHGSGRP